MTRHVPGRDAGALAFWEPAGREVRTGTWAEQATATPDAIAAALAEGRREEAAALARHLVTEAEEIHELYRDWCALLPRILAREGVPADAIAAEAARLAEETGAHDPDADWERFGEATARLAEQCRSGGEGRTDLDETVSLWRDAHDRHRDLVAGWIDVAVRRLGEERLGEVWAELQAGGIAGYARYDLAASPWETSFATLVQSAIEGMHGHLAGPGRRGELHVSEEEDRVVLSFDPCGSGGDLRARERFGTTAERHDWAWNELGVCHYCVHCCVLMQREPIRRLGYPARVIEPPLAPGDRCTWTVYQDPALVPDEAYERVGERRPGRSHGRYD